MKFLAVILFSIVGGLVLAQTGPGGVGSQANNSFWLDANKLSLTSGDGVTIFSDVSGNSNDFEQFVSSKQPTYQTAIINGLPAVEFDGSSDFMRSGSISDLESANLTVFTVYQKANLQKQGIIGGNYTSNSKQWVSYCNSNDNFVYNGQYSSGAFKHVRYNDPGAFTFSSTHITPTELTSYKDGVLNGVKTTPYTAPTGHQYVELGHYPSQPYYTYFLDGYIAEVFVYNSAINNVQRVIIENYLAAKYGFSIPEDYYSFQGAHKFGVIGIGNNGSQSHSDSKGSGVLNINTPASLGSNEYLFIGHTGEDLSLINTSNLPGTLPTHSKFDRTWRIDETGEVGNVNVVFDLSNGVGFADGSSYRLLIDNNVQDGNFSDALPVIGVFNAGAQTITFNVDLEAGDFITLAGIESVAKDIHSVQPGPWFTTSTWDCACVPSIIDTVYIDPTDNVTLDGDAGVYNLNITNTGTLTISSDFSLSIFGDMDIVGDLAATNGTIAFVGASEQNISANASSVDLHKVLIENTSDADQVIFTNGEYVLNNTMFPVNGDILIDNAGGGSLIVNSTSASTLGRIDRIYSGVTFTGNVSVRRFLPSGVAGERTLSSPVIGATLAQWDANLEMSGDGFPDGCAYGPDGCYHSVRINEHGVYSDVTDINTVLLPGEGYEVFLGTDLDNFDGATTTTTGAIHEDGFTTPGFPFSWNIQGNPFASPVRFSDLSRTGAVGNYYYIYDAAAGAYQWYDGSNNTSSSSDLANGIISIGQGYWTEGFGTITYTQESKTSSSAVFVRSNIDNESINLTLSQEGTTYKCLSSVDFNQYAFDDYDSLDIKHPTLGFEKASSLIINASGEYLRKQYLADNNNDRIIDLSVIILNDGLFTIKGTDLNLNSRYSSIVLVDKETGELINLSNNNEHSFYSTEGEHDRFRLILSNKNIQEINVSPTSENEINEGEITITQIGNAINVETELEIEDNSIVTITNLLGQEIIYSENITLISGSNIVALPSNFNGVYLVTVISEKGKRVTKKIIL
jgi:hypothetical protein